MFYFVAVDTTVLVLHREPLPETIVSRLRETMDIATSFKIIGNGSSGVVYQARLLNTIDLVDIKNVLQDMRFTAGPLINQW